MVDKFQCFSSKKLFDFDMKKKVGGGKNSGGEGKITIWWEFKNHPRRKKNSLFFVWKGCLGSSQHAPRGFVLVFTTRFDERGSLSYQKQLCKQKKF